MHPVIFSWGPIHLYAYGLLVATGVLSAVLFIRKNAERSGIKPDLSVDLAMVTVVSGFIGARIFYVVQFWNFFSQSPMNVFKIWEGGIVLYGGLIGGIIGFAAFIKWKRLPFLAALDLFIPALALAQGFGRLGCFLNGCCYGKVSFLPWAVQFPLSDNALHPTQLYEAIFCFALALFLIALLKKKLISGKVTAAYFLIYPTGRFLIEFFRGDQSRYLHLTLAQWISISVVGLMVILIFLKRIFDRGKNSISHSS